MTVYEAIVLVYILYDYKPNVVMEDHKHKVLRKIMN
jgi:hypothetical protein